MCLGAHQAVEFLSCSTTADTMLHSKVDTQGACHQAGGGSVGASQVMGLLSTSRASILQLDLVASIGAR